MARVKLVYYVDVLSSWCLVADGALDEVRKSFGPQVDIEWRIGALRDPFGYTPEQLAWYYKRTAAITGTRLNPVWLKGPADGSGWANLAAEAARSLGRVDDSVRLAIARGCMLDGKRACEREIAAAIACEAGKLDRAALDRAMDDPATAARINTSTEAFNALGVSVRPTFVLTSGIGDSTVLSGCWRAETLVACIRALLDDETGYERFNAADPPPPGAH
jgi:predicted DsbA family dithiol-disulfide isomerase